jgi:ribosomal protein S18 acetylase RimI-like enzyme
MELRRVSPSELEAVYELLASNGWAHRLSSKQEFAQLIQSSQLAEVALDDGEIVGFLRAITDGQANGYLSMVVVKPSHRGRGIGRSLVERAMGDNKKVTWVLRAGREGAAEFFAKLGFEASSAAMERRRK